jgi:hypothetical protein
LLSLTFSFARRQRHGALSQGLCFDLNAWRVEVVRMDSMSQQTAVGEEKCWGNIFRMLSQSEQYESVGMMKFPRYGKIKKCSKPPTSFFGQNMVRF